MSEDGNASTSVLSITPTREDHGKALSCRATNELVRNGIRETAMKLNVFCKYNMQQFNRHLYKFYMTQSRHHFNEASLAQYIPSQVDLALSV